jgi:hypothetical protein
MTFAFVMALPDEVRYPMKKLDDANPAVNMGITI